jgi:nucleoside-diphosphate-sugar epimerase
MKILITGVNGFIGNHLFNELSKNHEIIGIYNKGNISFNNCFKVDLTNEIQINDLFKIIGKESIHTIIHLASETATNSNLSNTSILYRNSIIAKNLSGIANKFGVKKFLNFSSSSVYPNIDGTFNEESIPNPAPNTDFLYGLSKYNSEVILNHFLIELKVKIIHLRIGMVYGKGMNKTRLIPKLEKEISEKNSLTLYGNGVRLINIIKVESLIRYVNFFISQNIEGIINLADECISVIDFAKRIIEKKGNNNTKIILVEKGNRNQFILDTKKAKLLTKKLDFDEKFK